MPDLYSKDEVPLQKIFVVIIFIVGISLRSIQFFGRSSMWFDELTNALNIQSRSFHQLATNSLDFNQVAPVGFLWFEKLATLWFGETDLAFRFFPWLLSITGMLIFYAISKKFLKGFFLLAVLLLYATSGSQLFYSGEAKQYSGDVACCLFLVWTCLHLIDRKSNIWQASLFGIAGVIAIMSSFAAIPLSVFLLLLIGAAWYRHQTHSPGSVLLIIMGCWLTGCLLGYLYTMDVITKTVQEDMSRYWSAGFAPTDNLTRIIIWIPKVLLTELSFFLTIRTQDAFQLIRLVALLILLASIAGFYYMLRKAFIPAVMIFAPLIVALALSLSGTLPFSGRVALYAIWPLLIGGMAGLQWISALPRRYMKPYSAEIVALIIPLPFIIIMIFSAGNRPPYHEQPSQPVLHELKKKMLPGDILYVYYKARHALHFYGPKEKINNYQIGQYYDNIDPYLRELDKLKGNPRVWFFYTQWTVKQPFPDTMKRHLGKKIGKQIDSIPDPYGGKEDAEAAAYLYDLR